MDKPKANPYAPFDLLLEELLERSCEHIIAEPGDELPLIRVSQAKRDLKQLVYALFDRNAELEAENQVLRAWVRRVIDESCDGCANGHVSHCVCCKHCVEAKECLYLHGEKLLEGADAEEVI